jgi:hypothetical protein
MLLNIYQITQHHIQEDSNLCSCWHENLRHRGLLRRWDPAQPAGTVWAPWAQVPLSCWTSAATLGDMWTSRPDIGLEPSSPKFCAQIRGDCWWTVGAAIQLAECGDRFWGSCHIHRLKQCVSVSGPFLVTSVYLLQLCVLVQVTFLSKASLLHLSMQWLVTAFAVYVLIYVTMEWLLYSHFIFIV